MSNPLRGCSAALRAGHFWNAFYAARMTSLPSIRDAWFPPEGEETAPYAAKHRIADHVRAVIERLVGLDVEVVNAEELQRIEETAAGLRAALDVAPDRRRHGSLAAAPLPEGALVERSPVSGRGNALAVPLTYEFDGDTTRAHCVFSAA